MCVPLAAIINKCLETGEVPNSLKLAKVMHIYKSKNKEEFNNYRSVIVVVYIKKMLEKQSKHLKKTSQKTLHDT